MSNKSKAVFFISLAAIAAAVYTIYSSFPINESKDQVDSGLIGKKEKEWKTYESRVNTFEIKYPDNWQFEGEMDAPPSPYFIHRYDDKSYCRFNVVTSKTDSPEEIEASLPDLGDDDLAGGSGLGGMDVLGAGAALGGDDEV